MTSCPHFIPQIAVRDVKTMLSTHNTFWDMKWGWNFTRAKLYQAFICLRSLKIQFWLSKKHYRIFWNEKYVSIVFFLVLVTVLVSKIIQFDGWRACVWFPELISETAWSLFSPGIYALISGYGRVSKERGIATIHVSSHVCGLE